jgi:DNA-binding MarR family transcriptional regulator
MDLENSDMTIDKIYRALLELEKRVARIEERFTENKNETTAPNEKDDVVGTVLSSKLDVDDCLFVHSLSGLPLLLSLLDMVSKQFAIEYISPSEIAAILSGKFNTKVERSNISHILSSAIARGYVDRVMNTRGSGYLYGITSKGSEYLREELSSRNSSKDT